MSYISIAQTIQLRQRPSEQRTWNPNDVKDDCRNGERIFQLPVLFLKANDAGISDKERLSRDFIGALVELEDRLGQRRVHCNERDEHGKLDPRERPVTEERFFLHKQGVEHPKCNNHNENDQRSQKGDQGIRCKVRARRAFGR